ncbi:MAG: hypothetical protein RLP44_26665 [Aggregatilineales bacterium]
MQHKRLVFVLMVLMTLLATTVVAQESMETTAKVSTVQVTTHFSQGEVVDIEGATATLISTEEGIAVRFVSQNLEVNHAYTVWVAIINNPEACTNSPCGPDVLGNPDVVQSEMLQGDNLLYTDEAIMEFTTFIPVGDAPEGEGWFGNGLTNPMGAEIHLTVQDHGELIPEMAGTMLNTVRGGCTDESVPPPYPEVGQNDGDPGPNTCRGIQLAIFQQ